MISLNSIKSAQSRLSASGLISVKIGSQGNRFDISNKTEYQLLSVSKFDTATDTATDTINKGNKTKRNERVKFTPPSLSEIQSCFLEKIQEKGSQLNPYDEAEKFEAFYASKNWMVGKNKMANWQKSLSGWIARTSDRLNGKSQPPQSLPKIPIL